MIKANFNERANFTNLHCILIPNLLKRFINYKQIILLLNTIYDKIRLDLLRIIKIKTINLLIGIYNNIKFSFTWIKSFFMNSCLPNICSIW